MSGFGKMGDTEEELSWLMTEPLAPWPRELGAGGLWEESEGPTFWFDNFFSWTKLNFHLTLPKEVMNSENHLNQQIVHSLFPHVII